MLTDCCVDENGKVDTVSVFGYFLHSHLFRHDGYLTFTKSCRTLDHAELALSFRIQL